MKIFESKKLVIKKPASLVFGFISDLRNFEQLMPDQITNWSATQDDCSFTITGMADISLKTGKKVLDKSLEIESVKAPFEININCSLDQISEDSCNSTIKLSANVNPMMAMMVSNPLQNLVNIMNDKLKEISEKQA